MCYRYIFLLPTCRCYQRPARGLNPGTTRRAAPYVSPGQGNFTSTRETDTLCCGRFPWCAADTCRLRSSCLTPHSFTPPSFLFLPLSPLSFYTLCALFTPGFPLPLPLPLPLSLSLTRLLLRKVYHPFRRNLRLFRRVLRSGRAGATEDDVWRRAHGRQTLRSLGRGRGKCRAGPGGCRCV